MTTELMPMYDSRKSFYGKARVNVNPVNGNLQLISYNTRVAVIHQDNTASVYGWYSNTTARHIRDFLQQNGFPNITKAQMESGELISKDEVL